MRCPCKTWPVLTVLCAETILLNSRGRLRRNLEMPRKGKKGKRGKKATKAAPAEAAADASACVLKYWFHSFNTNVSHIIQHIVVPCITVISNCVLFLPLLNAPTSLGDTAKTTRSSLLGKSEPSRMSWLVFGPNTMPRHVQSEWPPNKRIMKPHLYGRNFTKASRTKNVSSRVIQSLKSFPIMEVFDAACLTWVIESFGYARVIRG